MDQHLEETWQADVNGQVHDATFTELAGWINEGALSENDSVRKGNLRWIQAGKVPALVPFFNARNNGTPLTVMSIAKDIVAGNEHGRAPTSRLSTTQVTSASDRVTLTQPAVTSNLSFTNQNDCHNHTGTPIFYKCLSCGGGFCKQCARTFGSSVALCPECGEMCKPAAQFEAQTVAAALNHSRIGQGFGFNDLSNAFSHPFKFKTSLVIGAVMFAFASLGESALSMGGLYLIVGGIFSTMFANMLTFGVLSHTVDTFSQGQIERNFMPDFEDFDVWNDVIQPFFLSIGAYLSSFALFIIVAIVGFYMVANSVSSQTETIKQRIASTPGTPYYSGRDTVDQTKQVRDVLDQVKLQNDVRLKQQRAVENAAGDRAGDEGDAQFVQLQKEAEQSQRRTLESVAGSHPSAESGPLPSGYAEFLKLAAPLVVVGFLTFLWGMIYFPAACAVAGYTRSFAATLNPYVVLDTMKRLGIDYVKMLLMSLLICACMGAVSIALSLILLPFDLPTFGNLPAKFIGSIFTFYFWTVFSCLLGLLMYKASPRLGLRF